MSLGRVVFNGKFSAVGNKTGVHRVAVEIIRAFDQLLDSRGLDLGVEWVLMCPPDADPPADLKRIKVQIAGPLKRHYWEQIELPWLTRGDLLVSLCNISPVLQRGAIVMIHDAQTFSTPESYSRDFAAFYRFALPRIGRSAAKVLTVSDFSKGELVKYGVAPADRIEVIHNGVDHAAFAIADEAVIDRLGLSGRRFVVSFFSRNRYKNNKVLLEAFARPEVSDLALVFVGGDPERDGSGAPGNVVIAGRVSDAELAALYRHAVCAALPSTTEGFGLPPLEAMTQACPAVVSPCGALPEVCGDAAVYVEPHDPAAWAQALRRLADEPRQARAARIKAGQAHVGRFTWARSAEKLLDTIAEVVALRWSPVSPVPNRDGAISETPSTVS